MAGTLFLRSYERSERIYLAMQARGFEGTLRHMHGRGIRTIEWIGLAVLVAGLTAVEVAAHAGLF
jgi:cobalt/nickel transport system permease protein